MDSDWAGAPKHLLDLILENLVSSIHYLRFGIVCLRWHSVMEDNKTKRRYLVESYGQILQVERYLSCSKIETGPPTLRKMNNRPPIRVQPTL
ncbi:F-box domain containing protein [Parasponia andersonii]|uniref:F-box domain containing protein n=1 Tax=Parasponia andersonii TaxID=3476 RepID=A0A2P5C5K5_PARAD|nr:F-box domain containing protein [Parasponia andersonii]